MDYNMDYEGTRWFKCDFHVHTEFSKCFDDEEITPERWVKRAIEQGLDCVAVTDHNTGFGIDQIKDAAKGTELTVFPGVEITCDASKVHLLIIFDIDKTSDDINHFLAAAGFSLDNIKNGDSSITRNIFQITELATDYGALVIPAHIDECSGLGSISTENLKRFFFKYDINAVQVVHEQFLDMNLRTSDNKELKDYLNDYYNNPIPAIDDATIKNWHRPVRHALEANCAILTFSDNPKELKSSKHGIWGIGNSYTWIKMDKVPSLEGLRHSVLLPKHRIRNKFVSPDIPYRCPDLWIKKVTIYDTTVTGSEPPLTIDFNPQLNTIIGGRGSGKSSILRFIRGVFNRTGELKELEEILRDHNEFYKLVDTSTGKGVLNKTSKIEIEFVRNEVLHRIIASNIKNSLDQDIEIQKFDADKGIWEEVIDEGYIDFFKFDHYSQKQIYEIAGKPNALRERIDNSIEGMDKLLSEREHIKSMFLEKSASIRTIDKFIYNKGKIETRIKDLDASIGKIQKSGIANILVIKEKFTREQEILNQFKSEIEEMERKISLLADEVVLSDINYSSFNDEHKAELGSISKDVVDGFEEIKIEIDALKNKAKQLKDNYDNQIDNSLWRKDYEENILNLSNKKLELEEEGIDDIMNFEKLSMERTELEDELKQINYESNKRDKYIQERKDLQSAYLGKSKEVTSKRKEFVDTVLKDDKVRVLIKQFRDQDDFELKLRKILQRENNSYQNDITELCNLCFRGNVEKKIEDFRKVFLKIRRGDDVDGIVSGHFINLVNSLNDAQIDEIEILLPEDEIEVQYRTSTDSEFKSLSIASDGQKTTAILTFILSYGNTPLILDQPEDDLDNKLVYELIVDRLSQVKERRQLIVVTHNANIPVNADAEYIISMNNNGNKLEVLDSGTVEKSEMKKEICDVMEGGETAFKMRFKRYESIK